MNDLTLSSKKKLLAKRIKKVERRSIKEDWYGKACHGCMDIADRLIAEYIEEEIAKALKKITPIKNG